MFVLRSTLMHNRENFRVKRHESLTIGSSGVFYVYLNARWLVISKNKYLWSREAKLL